jgi:DNA-binding beta-propeller fold protein YncE
MRMSVASLASLLLLASAPASAQGLHLLKTLPVGGPGGWDYVTLDSAHHRLYVPRFDRVMVLDLDGRALGTIPGTDGVHGVALAPDLDRGFTSNGRSQSVTIFRPSTLEVLGHMKATGAGPDAILFDPFTRRVFSFNGQGKDITAYDAEKGMVVGSIPLGHKPEFAVADGKGRIYVNLEDASEVAALDATTLKVLHVWPLAPVEEPSGMAMDRTHRRLFIVGRNRLMAVMDADSGKVVATPAIGAGADAAAFDPGTGTAYSSNGEGTLTVVRQDSPDTYTVLEQVPTQRGARTMALDEATHRLYLPTADFQPAPAPAPGAPRQRPALVPDSFRILVVGR